MRAQIKPSQARVCRSCDHVVTIDDECPSCGESTKAHPEVDMHAHYCVECGKGPFLADTMHVITWSEDPYMQTDEADLITVCPKCKKKRDHEGH